MILSRVKLIGGGLVLVTLVAGLFYYKHQADKLPLVNERLSNVQALADIQTARLAMLSVAASQRDKTITNSEKKADETIDAIPVTEWGSRPVDPGTLDAIRLQQSTGKTGTGNNAAGIMDKTATTP